MPQSLPPIVSRCLALLALLTLILLTGGPVSPAHAQPAPGGAVSESAVAALLQRAEQVRAAEGPESPEFLKAVVQVLEVVQGKPAHRAANKRADYLLLEALYMDPHIGTTLAPRLQLAYLEFEDKNYAAALPLLQRSRDTILRLRAHNLEDSLRRWPEVQWLDETELALAESLQRLSRPDEAAQVYEPLIDRLRTTVPAKPALMARALHNAGALAAQQRRPELALQRIEASVALLLTIPDVDPKTLSEGLVAWVVAASDRSGTEEARQGVQQALAQARRSDIPRRVPADYLLMRQTAVMFYMQVGDMESALRTMADDGTAAAAPALASSGLQLALTLRGMELAAQTGNEAPFRSGWEGVRRQAMALPDEERRTFAEAARVMAWESVMPAIESMGKEGRRAYRAREVTELASSLLQGLLPLEHPRSRLVRMQEATWQFLTLDTPSARPALEGLLDYDAGTAEDAALRAFAMQVLAMVHVLERHDEAAIVLSKEALNAFHALPIEVERAPECGEAMCLNLTTIAAGGQAWAYKWLSGLLIRNGRLSEAQQLMLMLREYELADSLRGTAVPRDGRASLTGLERSRFQTFYRLREQQAALAGERQALQAQERAGTLTTPGRQRLQEIGRIESDSLRPAMAQFLRGLEVSMVAGADASVVQNSGNLRVEATQIQQDIDRWARETPAARAVGIQYLMDRDILYIVVTVPGLSPIARQLPLDRGGLYEAVAVAQTLLRTPRSADDRLRPALQKLHALLIAPIEQDLKKAGAHTLLLSLDDRLRQLPFAALVGSDGRYLVEDYALGLYNDAVPGAAPGPSRNWRVAAMGVSKPVGTLPALKAVPSELVQVVRASRGGGQTFLDGQFTRASLDGAMARKPAAPFNVLHLASHFVLQPGDAGNSTLYLGDGSSLSLAEMARRRFDFRGFELVVYSACESGIAGGRGADGMEMESLSALTRRQGASTVLGTLWKVSDDSVAPAMALFYVRSKQSGDSLAEALRQTQLTLLRGEPAGDARYRHPFHWAPFVLMGNWR